MLHLEYIRKLLGENKGYITASCCRDSGLSTVYLNRMVKRNEIETVARGLYKQVDVAWDDFFIYQYLNPKAVFSYETALALHGVSDKVFSQMNVTVPRHVKIRKDSNVIVHYEKDEQYSLGIMSIATPFGNRVNVYNLEKTLCDFIKHRSSMDSEEYVKFLRFYAASSNRYLALLGTYATAMGISEKVRSALEVLL